MVVRDLAVGAKLADVVFVRKFLRVHLIEGRTSVEHSVINSSPTGHYLWAAGVW